MRCLSQESYCLAIGRWNLLKTVGEGNVTAPGWKWSQNHWAEPLTSFQPPSHLLQVQSTQPIMGILVMDNVNKYIILNTIGFITILQYGIYYIILHYIISYHIILYYIILYHIITYHMILYYIISYHIILYYIILHYITLYYIILCYIILYIYYNL